MPHHLSNTTTMITIATTILRRRLQHHRQKDTHTLDTHTRGLRMPVRNTSKYRQPRAPAAVAAAAQATAVGPKRLPAPEPLAHAANTTCAKKNTCMNVEAHTVPATRTNTKHIATYNLPAIRAVPVAAATSILGAVRSRILVPVVQATTGERRLWSKMALAVGRESIVVDLLVQSLSACMQLARLHHTLHTILSWPAMFSFFNSASHLVHIPFQFYAQLLSTDRPSTTHYTHPASCISSFKQASPITITTPRTQFSAAESQ